MKRIDKIGQMSSKELAKAIIAIGDCADIICMDCPLYGSEDCGNPEKLVEWLEEEVQEDA